MSQGAELFRVFNRQPSDWEERLNKVKSVNISKQLVWKAYQRVVQNKGAAGVDGVSIRQFQEKWKDNLYKLWNRMASGSYFPPPVKSVLIPKKQGGERPLGIPTVADRIAQTVAALVLEPLIEPYFDADSYGYRPGKSALDAVRQARQRCWKYEWVIDMDIKGFFDNLDHSLMLSALERHTSCRWLMFYVERWLQASVQQPDGKLIQRSRGTPQGGVISPLLANLFLHYAFDRWLRKTHSHVQFERYADDIVVHCRTKAEAEELLKQIKERLVTCQLMVNEQKTQIVYCGVSKQKVESRRSFNFLGYTFRPRLAQSKAGKPFVGFLPAISNEAKKAIRQTIREWQLPLRIGETIESLATRVNPNVRGWVNYYGQFYRSEMGKPLLQVDYYLVRWIQKKFRKSTGPLGLRRALKYLSSVRKHKPHLFEHWRYGWIWVTD